MKANFLTLAVVSTALLVGTGARATDATQDDLKVILDQLSAQNDNDALRLILRRAYADAIAAYLAARSTKIRDRDRLAALLPDALTQSDLDAIRSETPKQCLKYLPPETRSALAARIRNAPKPRTQHTTKPIKLENLVETLEAELIPLVEDFATVLPLVGVVLCQVQLATARGRDIRAAGVNRPQVDSDVLVDILKTPGLVQFPNRIARKNVLAELRNGAGG